MKPKSTSQYITREIKRGNEPSLISRRRVNKAQEMARKMKEREEFFRDVEEKRNARDTDSLNDSNE